MCVAVVDKSVYLLRSGFWLTPAQETGLVVRTGAVSLNQRQDGSLYTDEAVPAFQPHTGSLGAAASSGQPPSDPSGKEMFSVQIPDSLTSWVGEAGGLPSAWGLGIAKPSLLKTFKPFFVDFMLPHHVGHGEQVQVPLSIYNYMGACAEGGIHGTVPPTAYIVAAFPFWKWMWPQIPSLPTGLFVSATGEGCCLLQIGVTYRVPDPVAKPSLQLLVRLQEPEAEQPGTLHQHPWPVTMTGQPTSIARSTR
ncbi:hypothetical protein HJG60_012026 [Phyllostomus discolor]|uniref:Alpha-2-macroglobulin domain-containing protein n=1 Tax=Phyllostomus discolor TaxID=89673 RepID=A0A834DW91_9CHIR|nr:hypothetical protein HJG60_012026 [Phyllostomus discolor]